MLPLRITVALLTGILVSLSSLEVAQAQEWIANHKQHAWGRFKPGSWKRVRVRTDKLDANGKVTSTTTTDSITTLVEANSDCYTLMVDSEVEVGRNVYRGRPKYLKRYFRNELKGEILLDESLGKDEVVVASAPISSNVRHIVYTMDEWKRETTVHYAQDRPFILRRVTKSHAPSGDLGYETEVRAKRVGLLRRILGEPRRVNEIVVVHQQDKHKTTTEESHCEDVPGGVVGHRLEQVDANGRVVSRSRLELIDYHVSTGKTQIRRGRRGLLPQRNRQAGRSRPSP